MLKKLQRIGGKNEVVHITIQIVSILVLRRGSIPPGTFLNVVYERKGKSKGTSSKPVVFVGDATEVNFEELLDFSATLYKDSSGRTMSKKIDLVIRNRKEDMGKVEIDLKDIQEATPTRFSLPIRRDGMSIEASLELIICIANYGDNIPDDMSSVFSDGSFASSSAGNSPASKLSYISPIKSPNSSGTGASGRDNIHSEDEVATLKMNLEKAVVDKENADSLNLELLRENRKLNHQIEDLKVTLLEQAAGMKAVTDMESALEATISDQSKEIQSLKQRLALASFETDKSYVSIAALQGALQDEQARGLELEAALSATKQLEIELQEANAANAQIEPTIQKMERALSLKHQKLTEASRRAEISQKDSTRWRDKYQLLEKHVAGLGASIDHSDVGGGGTTDRSISNLQEALSTKVFELEAIDGAKLRAEAEVTNLRTELHTRTVELREAVAQLRAREADVRDAQSAQEAAIAESNSAISNMQLSIDDQRRSLEAVISERQTLIDSLAAARTSREDRYDQDVHRLQAQVRHLLEKLPVGERGQEEEKSVLRNELVALHKDKETVEQQLVDANGVIILLQAKLEGALIRLAEAETGRDRDRLASQKNAQVKLEEFGQLRAEIDILSGQLTELHDKNSTLESELARRSVEEDAMMHQFVLLEKRMIPSQPVDPVHGPYGIDPRTGRATMGIQHVSGGDGGQGQGQGETQEGSSIRATSVARLDEVQREKENLETKISQAQKRLEKMISQIDEFSSKKVAAIDFEGDNHHTHMLGAETIETMDVCGVATFTKADVAVTVPAATAVAEEETGLGVVAISSVLRVDLDNQGGSTVSSPVEGAVNLSPFKAPVNVI